MKEILLEIKRSYISTVKKQGMNVISAIYDAYTERALLLQLE